jgi:hypothetical protein
MEGAMNTPPDKKDNRKHAATPVTNRLHPWIYAVLICLALWFVLWIWSFAGAGVTDYLLATASGFISLVLALTAILSRVGRNDPGRDADEAKAADTPASFHDWATSDFDTYQDRLSTLQAATLILLPIAAAAFGMTAFGIVFLIVETWRSVASARGVIAISMAPGG